MCKAMERIEARGDALGTSVGSKKDRKHSVAALTTFGESLACDQDIATPNIKHQTSNSQTFFTGVFSALGKLGKVIKVAGKIVDTSSDIGTDTGLASLLGALFEEQKVLFTVDLGIKTDFLQTARQHHLRSYVWE